MRAGALQSQQRALPRSRGTALALASRLLDARLEAAYPHVPLFHDQGIGVALFSYDGTLHWGLTADWDLVPDLRAFGESLAGSFEALCRAARIDRDERALRSAAGRVHARRRENHLPAGAP